MSSKSPLPIKQPEWTWLSQYFEPSLIAARSYKIDTPTGIKVKLDQNESPWDWPPHLKQKILERVAACEWNRYPDPMASSINDLLADYLGVKAENIMTSPGSNHLIGLILEALGRRLKGKVVITRPSFALFEAHAQYAGIRYETWDLGENFQYDPKRLPDLPPGSFVIFASPNNPTGNSLPKNVFKELLKAHPQTLFLADEAYYEFDDDPYTDLLSEHANLLILRTLSKTMGAAGIRLGYALGSPDLISNLSKLRLPYLLNHFTVEAAKVIFTDPEMMVFMRRNIENAKKERDRVFTLLQNKSRQLHIEVINSKANFLLLRFSQQEVCEEVYRGLVQKGILVRNVSGGPGLRACLRVSIGRPEENDAFLKGLEASCPA